jgi:hypothetical protein
MKFNTLANIRSAGFVGGVTHRALLESNCSSVPAERGVYLVVVRGLRKPSRFRKDSPGGRFKRKDPSVDVSVLRSHWVSGAAVLYIGQAGGGKSRAHLVCRVRAFVRFGAGEPVGHWGGRFVWQLTRSDRLLFFWKPLKHCDPIEVESKLIAAFVAAFGKRPFANLKNGRVAA